MAGPLETWIIHFSFYAFIQLYSYTGCIFFSLLPKPIFPYEMSFYQNPIKYCNMAIYCNTLKHNTQYGIDPYCFTPSSPHTVNCAGSTLSKHNTRLTHTAHCAGSSANTTHNLHAQHTALAVVQTQHRTYTQHTALAVVQTQHRTYTHSTLCWQ